MLGVCNRRTGKRSGREGGRTFWQHIKLRTDRDPVGKQRTERKIVRPMGIAFGYNMYFFLKPSHVIYSYVYKL